VARVAAGCGWRRNSGSRINHLRFQQLSSSGTKDVAVACPYCFSMLSDAQNETGHEEAVTWDVIELVEKAAKA
jgi:Fe-S oxidoreductase